MSAERSVAAAKSRAHASVGLGDPVFLCGSERSGTTLLRSLLDGHSQLLVFPEETRFLETYRARPDVSVDHWVELMVRSPDVRQLMSYPGPSAPGARAGRFDFERFVSHFRVRVSLAPEARSVLPALLDAYAEVSGQGRKRYWVEKTPYNEFSLPQLSRWYPRLRALYMLRDPRAVYCSLATKKLAEGKQSRGASLIEFACRWARSLLVWERFAEGRGAGLLVRYEDLVMELDATLDRVCSFLEIEREPVLSRPLRGPLQFRGNSSFAAQLDSVSTEPLDRWRQLLPSADVAILEQWLGAAMTRHGYECSAPRQRALASFSQLPLERRALRHYVGIALGLNIRAPGARGLAQRLLRDA